MSFFSAKELDENTSVGISDISVPNRAAKLYNLDVVISIGYRVNSSRGIFFRKWANKILKDYLIQGYAVNQKRLDTLGKVIDKDVHNALKEELDKNSVWAKFARTGSDGKKFSWLLLVEYLSTRFIS